MDITAKIYILGVKAQSFPAMPCVISISGVKVLEVNTQHSWKRWSSKDMEKWCHETKYKDQLLKYGTSHTRGIATPRKVPLEWPLNVVEHH